MAQQRRRRTPRDGLLDKLMTKARLSARESDSLDYMQQQQQELIFPRTTKKAPPSDLRSRLRGFEASSQFQRAQDLALTLFLDQDGVVYGVDFSTTTHRKVVEAIEHLCSKMFVGEHFRLLLGGTYKLDHEGTRSLQFDLSFNLVWPLDIPLNGGEVNFHDVKLHRERKPDKGKGSNSADHKWPLGVISIGVARTLPEMLDTGYSLLEKVAEIGIFVGFKQYEMKAEQLVAFCCYKRGGGEIVGEAYSFGDKPLDESTVQVLQEREMTIKGLGYDGAGVCDRPGMDSYKMLWPGEGILYRTTDRPDKSVADTVLDLFYVRAILRGDVVQLPPPQHHPRMMNHAYAREPAFLAEQERFRLAGIEQAKRRQQEFETNKQGLPKKTRR